MGRDEVGREGGGVREGDNSEEGERRSVEIHTHTHTQRPFAVSENILRATLDFILSFVEIKSVLGIL